MAITEIKKNEIYRIQVIKGYKYVNGIKKPEKTSDMFYGKKSEAKAKENEDAKITALFIVLMLCIPVLMIVAQSRKNTRCPQCGRHTLRPVRRQTVQLSATETLVTTILKCDNCGSEHTRTENQNNHRGGGGGIWIMPMGGFGGGRGGFGGGGFGGGSFGGGGSGSRW